MNDHPRNSEELEAAIKQLAALEGFASIPVAASTQTILSHFAAGDPTRPLPRVEADWDEVFRGVCRNGLLGLAQLYLAQHNGEGASSVPPESFRRAITRAQSLNALRLAVHSRATGRTLAGLAQAGLDPLTLKGPALAQLVYSDPALRPFADLDLLVRECEVG